MTKQTTIVLNGGLVNQLLREQSDLGPYCLIFMLLNTLSDDKADNNCEWGISKSASKGAV